jgi:hypothetical protein
MAGISRQLPCQKVPLFDQGVADSPHPGTYWYFDPETAPTGVPSVTILGHNLSGAIMTRTIEIISRSM